MTPDQLKQKLETLATGTKADVVDLTGTMDHYQVVVVSPLFDGPPMMEQHRMVMAHLQKEIDSEEVHALSMKTYSPAQFEKFGRK